MYLHPGVYSLVRDTQETVVWKQQASWLTSQERGGSSVLAHPTPVEGHWSHRVGGAGPAPPNTPYGHGLVTDLKALATPTSISISLEKLSTKKAKVWTRDDSLQVTALSVFDNGSESELWFIICSKVSLCHFFCLQDEISIHCQHTPGLYSA